MAKVTAMSFVGPDLKKVWGSAERFAGPGGRVATMPDLIEARLADPPTAEKQYPAAWSSYYSTSSAEYAGTSKKGEHILIVAHGIGPLSTVKGALAAYKDHEHSNHPGGRISREEFLKLEAGHYGRVDIVPIKPIYERYQYPFIEHLTADQCKAEPLMRARLGPRWLEFIEVHDKVSRELLKAENKEKPKGALYCILDMADPSSGVNYALGVTEPWCNDERFKGKNGLAHYPEIGGPQPKEAFAHLLSLGQLTNSHLPEAYHRGEHIMSDVGCHGAGDHCRFMGVKADAKFNKSNLVPGLSSYDILRKHWRDLFVPVNRLTLKPARLRQIEDIAKGACFTFPPKSPGHNMGGGAPEFFVRARTKITDASFKTEVQGYYGFLRYDIKEVEAIAPPEANAYELGDAQCVEGAKYHHVNVTFYKAEIDFARRLMTADELDKDYQLFVRLSTGE